MKFLLMILLWALGASVNAENTGQSDLAPLLLLNADMSTWPRDNPHEDPPGFQVISTKSSDYHSCELSFWCGNIQLTPTRTLSLWRSANHYLYGDHVYKCTDLNYQPSCDELDWYDGQRANQ